MNPVVGALEQLRKEMIVAANACMKAGVTSKSKGKQAKQLLQELKRKAKAYRDAEELLAADW